jgi:HAD superfamily hydrolase (TIGR01549 family)
VRKTQHIGNHIRAVLFDHDDTLVSTIEAKWAEHKYIAKTYYGKRLTDDEIRQHWGKPLSVMVGLLYGTNDMNQAMAYNTAAYEDFPKKLEDDTIATLGHLHESGKKLGVITATHSSSLNYDFETLDIPRELFDYIQTEDNTSFHKPDPRVFEPALAWLGKLGIEPSEVVYVGDGLHDMEAALAAGFEFIGIATGLVTQDEFKANGATAISKLRDLIEV